MKLNEKHIAIRKKQGLSQEELGMKLQVSRQTISKQEAGQSYPDFQKLVMLSGYFGMSLDELVKDMDVHNVKYILGKWCKMVCYVALPYEAPPKAAFPFFFFSYGKQ